METFLENTANNDFDDDGEDDENDEDYEDGFEDDEDEDEDEDDYEDEDDVQSGDGMKLSTDDRQGIIMMMMEVRRSCLGLFVRLFAHFFLCVNCLFVDTACCSILWAPRVAQSHGLLRERLPRLAGSIWECNAQGRLLKEVGQG